MKYKIHLLSANSSNPYGMESFVKKAFEKIGYTVICTDYRIMSKELVELRIKFIQDCDFLLCIKGERVLPEAVYLCKIPTILWLQDSVQVNKEAQFILQTKAKWFDLVYTFDNSEIPIYKNYGIDALWLPLAADPDMHCQSIKHNSTLDISFIGALYPNRIKLMEYILQKYSVYYGHTMDHFAELVSSSKINLNLGILPTGNQQRIFEILNMGGFLLTNNIPDDNKLFTNQQHLVYYDPSNLLDLIDFYLKNEKERKRVAKLGRIEVLNKHLYEHRVRKIIDDLYEVSQCHIKDIIKNKTWEENDGTRIKFKTEI